MSNGLAYFKKVYDDVPGWVQKMHEYSADALDHYTGLRSGTMKDGHLSTKEKDLLLVGMNAARLYERSMVYHTKGAMDRGATIPELVEYLLVPYLYNGDAALRTALVSLEYARSFESSAVPNEVPMEAVFNRMIELVGSKDSGLIKQVKDAVLSGDQETLEPILLADGIVTSKLKHILIAGIYCTELQGKSAGKWMDNAREHGATEDELAEMGLICLLTAGIPAWFEASDCLKEK